MSSRSLLEALAPLPDETMVPAKWIREQLADESQAVDLTIEAAARILDCAPSTLRNHVHELVTFGAYKSGRRWKIPEEALREWERWRGTASPAKVDVSGDPRSTDLSAWRKERSR